MTVTVKFTRPGKGTSEFKEVLVVDRPDVKVLLLEQYSSKPIYQNQQLILGPAAPIVWFVFPGQWYEIGRFHEQQGTFTGWYTNLCTPFNMNEWTWSTTDLFLDFWQPANGESAWLDEDELAAAALNGLLDSATQTKIRQERESISRQHADGRWPPHVAREFTLDNVREILSK